MRFFSLHDIFNLSFVLSSELVEESKYIKPKTLRLFDKLRVNGYDIFYSVVE